MFESASPICPLGLTPLVFNVDEVHWECPGCGYRCPDSELDDELHFAYEEEEKEFV